MTAPWKEDCWHCHDARICDCIICGKNLKGGAWVAGDCLACKGRAAEEALWARPEMQNVDPRDFKHWRLEKIITGGYHRVFDPKV